MRPQQIANFNGLALLSRATAQIPSYSQALGTLQLLIGGGLLKSNVSEILLKIGSKTVFGPINAVDLDKLMAYRGHLSRAAFIDIDFCERDAKSQQLQELGAIDIPSLGGDALFLEVVNTLAAGGPPTIVGQVGFVPRQGEDNANGKPSRRGQLIHKLIRYSLPNTGTRFVWQPQFGGAQIKRVHFVYAGTDWTSTADGNLFSVDFKLNGRSAHDRPRCLPNRFYQERFGKVPQSRMYTVDFIADNIIGQAIDTRKARSLEFILELTASDNVTAYVECLDMPGNL